MKPIYHTLFLATGPQERIESRVMHQMKDGIKALDKTEQDRPRPITIVQQESFFHIFKTILAVLRSQTIVVHSPLIRSSLAVILSRCLRKNVVSFIWDVYPVTINGRRYNTKLIRIILDFIECSLVKMCDRKIVPSADFCSVTYLENAHIINFWPKFPLPKADKSGSKHNSNDTLKVIFTGQVNETRGLLPAVNHLEKITNGNFELRVASGNSLPDELLNHDCITSLGYLEPPALKAELLKSDAGLICLSPDLDTPGFPSKIFDYVKAGLPSLYFGPSLEAYISILETSGVGINVCSCEGLDKTVVENLKVDIGKNAIQFREITCLTNSAVLRFLAITNPV